MLDKYTPQQIETVMQLAEEGKLKEVTEIVKQALTNNNLLVVVLKDETSAPKVFYKGKETPILMEAFLIPLNRLI